MKFEKWQALGNDYLIVEAAVLPWELTEARTGVSATRTSAWAPTASCCWPRSRTQRTSPNSGSSTRRLRG